MIPFTCPCCEVSHPPHRDDCSFHNDCPTTAKVFDEVSSLRAEIARLREERRWIPVGERLPEHGDSVWVFDGTDVVIGEYWGTWQSYGASCDHEGLNSETLLNITHWTEIRQPLPPGPEANR